MLSINGVLSKLRVVIPRLAVIRSAAVPLYCVRPLSAKPSVVANTSTTDEPAHLQYSGKQFLTLDHDLPVYENTRSAVLRRMSYIALGQFGLCTLAVPWVLSVDSYDVASRYGIAAGILCAGGTLLAMGDRMLGRFVCNVYLLPGGKRARMTTMRLLGTKTSEFDVSDVVISDTAVQEYKQGQPSIQFEVRGVGKNLMLDLNAYLPDQSRLEYLLFNNLERANRQKTDDPLDLGRIRSTALKRTRRD